MSKILPLIYSIVSHIFCENEYIASGSDTLSLRCSSRTLKYLTSLGVNPNTKLLSFLGVPCTATYEDISWSKKYNAYTHEMTWDAPVCGGCSRTCHLRVGTAGSGSRTCSELSSILARVGGLAFSSSTRGPSPDSETGDAKSRLQTLPHFPPHKLQMYELINVVIIINEFQIILKLIWPMVKGKSFTQSRTYFLKEGICGRCTLIFSGMF